MLLLRFALFSLNLEKKGALKIRIWRKNSHDQNCMAHLALWQFLKRVFECFHENGSFQNLSKKSTISATANTRVYNQMTRLEL